MQSTTNWDFDYSIVITDKHPNTAYKVLPNYENKTKSQME